ncbi:MAG: hypothetical protein JO203_03370 [Gammaproteobacteria bacterium]|nr:hypothetical protein [Gammaproteobacteria bacterium]
MAKKPKSGDERDLHRVLITCGDLQDAEQFVIAAMAREREGTNLSRDLIYQALVCAAVIYYARAVGPNEHPIPSKRPKNAAAHRVNTRDLRKVLGTPERWRLHNQVLAARNKILAHAESKYFPVKMVRAEWPADPKLLWKDFGFQSVRSLPVIDLSGMRANARAIRTYYRMHGLTLADRVRPGKRLRPPKRGGGKITVNSST